MSEKDYTDEGEWAPRPRLDRDCHPADRCPSSGCHGMFFLLRHYGVICSVRLEQLTGNDETRIYELFRQAQLERLDGVGGA